MLRIAALILALLSVAPQASAQQFYANLAGTATGGIATSDGAGNTVITFIASGTLNLTTAVTAKALVCAAGGGGAGGGGAGGKCVIGFINIPAGSTAITVGIGGVGGIAFAGSQPGVDGTGSSIGSLLTATGGGGAVGSSQTSVTNGGGCGPGFSVTCVASAGTQPFAGGSVTAVLSPYAGAGGGGAGGPGGSTAGGATAGAGGIGIFSSITGTSTGYGGGGGGGVGGNGTGGSATSGGGVGRFNTQIGISAVENSAGGGGGTGFNGGATLKGGSGSNGIVIISCPAVSCGAAPTVTPYTGQVATRSYMLARKIASTTGWNSRTAHYVRIGRGNSLTSIKVDIANWYIVANAGEQCPGGTKTINNLFVEYPAGTRTQITFSGSNSVVIADCAEVVSDAITPSVSIPDGALIWFDMYQIPSVAVLMGDANSRPVNLTLGEATNNANTDQTSGTITNTAGFNTITPQAIIGLTSVPSIGTIASSRMVGDGDTVLDTNGDTGYTRLFGRYFAYIDTGLAGDTIGAVFGSGGAKRRALIAANTSHEWLDPGLNDAAANMTPVVTVEGWLASLATGWSGGLTKVIINNEAAYTGCGAVPAYSSVTTYFTGDWVVSGGVDYQSLIDNNLNNTPGSSPGDWQSGSVSACSGWNQTAGQVTQPAVEGFRVSLNTWINSLTGYNQIVDANSFEGTGHNFQYWNTLDGTQPGPAETPDGVHENTAILNLDVGKPIFNPNLITLP